MQRRIMANWKSIGTLIVLLALGVSAWIGYGSYRAEQDTLASGKNLKYLVLAMQGYSHYHGGKLPPAALYSKDGKPLLSWRVLLLPYLEQVTLFEKFKLDEPWDSPHNKPLLAEMPAVYAPVGGPTPQPYSTFYRVFVGAGTAFEGTGGLSLSPGDFPDGLATTLLIVEGDETVPWTKPEEIPYAANQPLPKLGGQFRGAFCAAFASGAVRLIEKGADENRIRAAVTRNGGEPSGLVDPRTVDATGKTAGAASPTMNPQIRAAVAQLMDEIKDTDRPASMPGVQEVKGISEGGEAAVRALIDALSDPDRDIRQMAALALREVGREGVSPLPKPLAQDNLRLQLDEVSPGKSFAHVRPDGKRSLRRIKLP